MGMLLLDGPGTILVNRCALWRNIFHEDVMYTQTYVAVVLMKKKESVIKHASSVKVLEKTLTYDISTKGLRSRDSAVAIEKNLSWLLLQQLLHLSEDA